MVGVLFGSAVPGSNTMWRYVWYEGQSEVGEVSRGETFVSAVEKPKVSKCTSVWRALTTYFKRTIYVYPALQSGFDFNLFVYLSIFTLLHLAV